MRGETVKVISPTGKEYEVLISNELNGFVPDSPGHYKFIYNEKTQVVCVKPSNISTQPLSKVKLNTFLEDAKIGFSPVYAYDRLFKMILEDINITLYLDTCFSGGHCQSNSLSRVVLNLDGAPFGSSNYSVAMKLLLEGGIFCVKNTGKIETLLEQGEFAEAMKLRKDLKESYVTLQQFREFNSSSLLEKRGLVVAAKMIKTEAGEDLLSVILFPSDKTMTITDGILVSRFLINPEDVKILSHEQFYVHDTSICPLEQ
jgi:hypothetical protein